jgi:hypothetical protein
VANKALSKLLRWLLWAVSSFGAIIGLKLMKTHRLEFWADSFHEGHWACEELSKFFKIKKVTYEKGFIPIFLFEIDSTTEIEITVLGSYKNWSPLPKPIEELLEWGKPDLVAYDPISEKILFAMEETAAVPTGNQALQRCERIYGSLRLGIPFWYLLGEFGLHVDGGVRRDSIWPTVLGVKLSCIQRTPCMVLHYSDQEHPEDYSVGEGVKSLYTALSTEIEIFVGKKKPSDLNKILSEQYGHMLRFIESQGANLVNFIPNKEVLYHTDTPARLAALVTSEDVLSNNDLDFFNWGKTSELPEEIYKKIKAGGVIKPDAFIDGLEALVSNKSAYTLSSNAGSRPQDVESIELWLSQQKALFEAGNSTDATFSLKAADFPPSPSGRLHVTTAKNVFYLVDSVKDVEKALTQAYKRLQNLKTFSEKDLPAFVYISNSLKPGRIFGDPFTGQLSAFANIFTKNVLGDKTRLAIAYYPHQVHTQLLDRNGRLRRNKGVVLMSELLDFAIFQGGVVVNMKSGEII